MTIKPFRPAAPSLLDVDPKHGACRLCKADMTIPFGYEPTELCHECAHREVDRLTLRVDELEGLALSKSTKSEPQSSLSLTGEIPPALIQQAIAALEGCTGRTTGDGVKRVRCIAALELVVCDARAALRVADLHQVTDEEVVSACRTMNHYDPGEAELGMHAALTSFIALRASSAELDRLLEAVKGPHPYATWQDAAVAERNKRVLAENELKAKS